MHTTNSHSEDQPVLHLHQNYKWITMLQYYLGGGLSALLVFGTTVLVSGALISEANQATPNGGAMASLILWGIALYLALGYPIAAWWYRNYTYQLTSTVFIKEYGILTRRKISIPYERIQNVDIIAPLLYRFFGLAQLNIQTAGGSAASYISEGRLPGLGKAEASRLQAELLERAVKRRATMHHQDPAAVN